MVTPGDVFRLDLRHQELTTDDGGHAIWREIVTPTDVPAAETAVLLCDVWDSHWCRGAVERLEAMVGRMNAVVEHARARGAAIIHAPSDTMDFYADTPARQRMVEAPAVEPQEHEHDDPPLPIDASDQGADTGETETHKAWTRQHPAIGVANEDGISDDGREVYNYLQQRGIKRLLVMGVHTNMCVLHRSFGIKQMVRWGVRVALIRDLTDTMYNPARTPYVSHNDGTRLVVGYIEKFWCPSIDSSDVVLRDGESSP